MSPVAIVIILIGALIALTRGPLIFAPLKVRDFYLRLLDSDGRMRGIGISIALLGTVCIWTGQGGLGTAATLLSGFGVFLVVVATAFFILFAHAARRLATSIWGGFSETTLRLIGIASTVTGLALVYYGLSI